MSTLTVCLDCRKPISQKARTCPHCGSPQSAGSNTAGRVIGRIVSLLAVILFGAAAYGSYSSESQAAASESAAYALVAGVSLVAFIILLRK